jgi:RNA polymerase sigma-54 factor
MADQGLYQTQTQKLAIGPQMQQSLQILQAPTLELRQIIQQEIEINPVLELESPDSIAIQDRAGSQANNAVADIAEIQATDQDKH